MKILVTGASGQLGIDAVNLLSKNNEVTGLDSMELDITNIDDAAGKIKNLKPDVIINCAAYTNVDGCEKNSELAFKVNAAGVKNLAIAAAQNNIKLLHISTDFVFDGEKNRPYLESDKTNPLNIYGKSKLQGEEFIKEICHKYFILRTAWLYGRNGNNFVKTMLRLAEDNKVLKVVDDQVGSPTFTKDLVDVIAMLIKTDAYGLYHVTNNGQCSWNEFAKKIFMYADINNVDVQAITSEELNRPAKRPKYSVLENNLLEDRFSYYVRDWESGLKEYFSKI